MADLKYKSQEGKSKKILLNKLKNEKEEISVSQFSILQKICKEFDGISKMIGLLNKEKDRSVAVDRILNVFASYEKNAVSGQWKSCSVARLLYLSLIRRMRAEGILDPAPELEEEVEEQI